MCNWIESETQTIPNVILEKSEFEIFNKTLFKDVTSDWKAGANHAVEGRTSLIITQPVNEMWGHYELYYKEKDYQKYMLDIWLETCDVLKAPAKHPIVKKMWDNFLNYRNDLEMNFDPQCPFFGNVTIKSIRGLNPINFVVPLMKPGQYRLDVSSAPYRNGPLYSMSRIYARITDVRV